MKEVFLIVEFMSNGESAYVMQYTGVMSQRYVYGKLTQLTGCPQDPAYIRVARKDTINRTDDWESLLPRLFRHIQVPYEFGLRDPRIDVQCSRFSIEVMNAIEKHVQKNEEEIKKFFQ